MSGKLDCRDSFRPRLANCQTCLISEKKFRLRSIASALETGSSTLTTSRLKEIALSEVSVAEIIPLKGTNFDSSGSAILASWTSSTECHRGREKCSVRSRSVVNGALPLTYLTRKSWHWANWNAACGVILRPL